MSIPNWKDRALCAADGPNDDLWFPHEDSRATVELAKSLCRQCPVRNACLQDALDQGPSCYGIWGGLTERQRASLRRRTAQEAS